MIGERCITDNGSMPPMAIIGYNSNIQIVQTSDYVVIIGEMVNDARIIRLDSIRQAHSMKKWMGENNFQIVHAAGVGLPHGGVIITGKSGAGKSSSSVSCLNSELGFAGDENMVLFSEPPYTVHSIYTSVNLDQKSRSLLPFLDEINPSEIPGDIEKKMYFLQENFKHKIINSFPLKGIIVSQISGEGASTLKPASKILALTELAPTSIFQIPGNKGAALKRMNGVIQNIPCFQLTIGESLADVPKIISEFLG